MKYLKLKKNIISVFKDEIFKIEEEYNIIMLYSESVLFSNFWDFDHNVPNYYMTPLPGKTEEVNGSIIGGYLFGINSYISDEKKAASAEVIKFLTSEYVQKEIILKYFRSYSGLFKLYDDEEVCSYTDCELIKNIQGIERPSSLIDNYEDYSSKYTTLISEFLFNNKPIKEVLSEIEDITKIYYFSIKTSTLGLIFFIVLITIFYIILFMTVLLFIPKYKKFIKFLTNDLWLIYIFGIILIIISGLTKFDEINIIKCNLNHVFLSIGLNFVLNPILYELIINFPKINKFSTWIKNNKYKFIIFIEAINIILNLLLLLISSYNIKIKVINDNKNYCICILDNKFGISITIIQIIIPVIKYLIIIVLIFFEWNMVTIYHEIRVLIVIMGMDGILFILFTIYKFIKIENYVLYHTLYLCIILMFCFTNHTYLFAIRVLIDILTNSNSEQEKLIDKVRKSGKLHRESLTVSSYPFQESSISKNGETSSLNGNIRRDNLCPSNNKSESRYSQQSLLSKIITIHNSRSFD